MARKGASVYRTSRLSYSLYYLMVSVIVAIIVYIKINGLYIDKYVLISAVLFCFVLIKITEVHRFSHYCDIMEDGLEKVEGIFISRHKKLNYGSISQIHITQSLFGKLFNVGTVELAQFSDTVRTEIKNISHPKRFIKEVAAMIHKLEVKKARWRTASEEEH